MRKLLDSVRRHWISSLVLAALLTGAWAAPAGAGFFLGDPLDGPSADVRALGDLDLARDGTGALVHVRAVDGVDHVFVSRFENGAFQALERLDAALGGASSQPVVGASDGGRLAIAFVNAGTVYGAVRPSGGAFTAPVPLGTGAAPAVDLSINGTAFASFTAGAADVRIARLDRRTNAWTTLAQPLDVDPARVAGAGSGRSDVAISADGVGIVTWGEAGRVYARKVFNTGLSNAPQDLTPPSFADRVATTSDLPDVDTEDDSSYAWVVFRQVFADGGSRILARRQRGTQFDAPVAVDTADEVARDPRIDLNGRGRGLATVAGTSTGQPIAALLDKRDVFGLGGRILTPAVEGSVAVPSISENDNALVAAVLDAPGVPAAVAVRPYVDGVPGPEIALSRPELGAVNPGLGFDAASDRGGGVVVAWVQGGPADRRIVTGFADRPPSNFVGYTAQRCCQGVTPALRWQQSFNLWGALRYEVLLDGAVIAQTATPGHQVVAPLKGGTHTWQVRATDLRGQVNLSKPRMLRIDGRKPLLKVRYQRRKRVVSLSVGARDNAAASNLVSGMQDVVISWGDRTPGARGRARVRATHRYRRKGTYPLTITARDKAGNEVVSKRTVRVG